MDRIDESQDIVHPEVRAHINSLVSALGGFSSFDDGRYVLGDSALEVLRDLKKWIRFYDEKTNRMDVARCLLDANVIEGDLLHILASWPENAADNKFKSRAALSCIELLVPMTWPLDREVQTMTVNHHRHMPVLQLAQIQYKRSIINFDAAQILHTAVRTALPSLALPRTERTPRDDGIIKLVLLFLRNIAMISPPPGVKYDGDESQISRSALLDAFSYQDILLTILTLASNMGEDFNQECVIIMEIIFHLVKRVDVTKLFMEDKELSKARANELSDMMNKEAAMHRPYNKRAPSRHNRWGTMIWVDRGDGKMSTISGQDALLDAATRQQKMDNAKVFRPPKRARKDDMEPKDLGPPVSLNSRARTQLRGFVEDFLDSGFNPLFQLVRQRMEEGREYVLDYHYRQFFYLISWFLEAQRVRKKATKTSATTTEEGSDIRDYNLVASVLNQETFVALNRCMTDALEGKRWYELSAAMRCFTQILLTVQDMSESGNEDDEDIADNILNRIFYEEETHDRVAQIARGYKDQDFEYLDACVELTHTYLRVLEAYSKQNTDLQIRSRRRTRKKKKAAKAVGDAEEVVPDVEDDSEADKADAEKQTKERKFDFARFAGRFVTQGVVDTFVKFTKFYHDLNESQLKRAHRYLYRVAFKQDMSVMLFRVDIIHLLYNMIKGPEPLDKSNSTYKEWEELVKQILRKCNKKIQDRPQLIIEMLFSKINATVHYLEYGHEKQTISTAQAKPAAELEFKTVAELDKQIAIVVGVLLDKNLAHHINFVKDQLNKALTERQAWEAADKAMASVEAPPPVEGGEGEAAPIELAPDKEAPSFDIQPEDEARRTAMFKNSHLRLLMKLVGIERLAPSLEETSQSAWHIPGSVKTDHIQDSLDAISAAEFEPPTFDNGLLAEHQLRRKTAPRKKAVFDDEDDALPDNDDDLLFPAGGPTDRVLTEEEKAAKKNKKTIRRRRRRDSNAEEPTEEELEEKARARREKELEKARRFKSDIYVHASDDESDDERWADFMANEEAIRKRQGGLAELVKSKANEVLKPASVEKKKKKKKRKVMSDDDEEEEGEGRNTPATTQTNDEDEDMPFASQTSDAESQKSDGGVAKKRRVGGGSKRQARRRAELEEDSDALEEEDDDAEDTPLSSARAGSEDSDAEGAKTRRSMLAAALAKVSAPDVEMEDDTGTKQDAQGRENDDDEDEEVVVPTAAKRRARTKAGFIVDDSSDDE